MEMKWIMIAFAVVFTGMFVGLGANEYHKGQCRIEAIKAKMPSDDIAKICK